MSSVQGHTSDQEFESLLSKLVSFKYQDPIGASKDDPIWQKEISECQEKFSLRSKHSSVNKILAPVLIVDKKSRQHTQKVSRAMVVDPPAPPPTQPLEEPQSIRLETEEEVQARLEQEVARAVEEEKMILAEARELQRQNEIQRQKEERKQLSTKPKTDRGSVRPDTPKQQRGPPPYIQSLLDYGQGIPQEGSSYSISGDMMEYFRDGSDAPSASLKMELARWREDEWAHLVNPPPDLSLSYFWMSIVQIPDNRLKVKKLARANKNLQIARLSAGSVHANKIQESDLLKLISDPLGLEVEDSVNDISKVLEEVVITLKKGCMEINDMCRFLAGKVLNTKVELEAIASDFKNQVAPTAQHVLELQTKVTNLMESQFKKSAPVDLAPGTTSVSSFSSRREALDRTRRRVPQAAARSIKSTRSVLMDLGGGDDSSEEIVDYDDQCG